MTTLERAKLIAAGDPIIRTIQELVTDGVGAKLLEVAELTYDGVITLRLTPAGHQYLDDYFQNAEWTAELR